MTSLTLKELIGALFYKKDIDDCEALELFSKKFAEYIGVSFALPTPSARVALAAILNAIEIPQGGEVILPSLVYHCIPKMFQEFGFRPRFVDIKPDTYCINADQVESSISGSTVAIMPTHLYGRACNMEAIMQIAENNDLTVIEDCAQSCGGFYGNKRLGNFGQAAIFSLHPHKNIAGLGTGMLVTNSRKIADKAKSWLKQFPLMRKLTLIKQLFYAFNVCLATKPLFWNNMILPVLKLNSLTGIDVIDSLTSESYVLKKVNIKEWFMPLPLHGRLGLSQLDKLDILNKKRIQNGNRLLKSLKNIKGIDLPSFSLYGENIYSTFVIRVQNRKQFRRDMRRLGVDTHKGDMSVGPYLPGLINAGEFYMAADVVQQMVHLPVYPQMDELDVGRVAKAVAKASSNYKY